MVPMEKRQINYGKSAFKTLIESNYRYVDKTEVIYRLIKENSSVFLSRPRRFGKTLLVDILSEIFQGNKDLFQGLSIYDKDYDWKRYPVIRLDMSKINRKTPELFEETLTDNIRSIGLKLGVDLESLTRIKDPSSYISQLLESLYDQGKKSVILIDEYDYPVIGNMDTGLNNMKKMLEVMKEFYISLKANDNYIHFLLLTGVTRIARSSIFSGMNNLDDISFDSRFCDLTGYTQEDLEKYFSSEIDQKSQELNISKKDFIYKIKDWYDGYRFSDSSVSVYNPADINLFFRKNCEFVSYWIQTGTPSFLVSLLSKASKIDMEKEFILPRGSNFFLSNLSLEKLDDKDNLIRLFYQTGYLSINRIESVNGSGKYYLGFPNREVAVAFTSYIVESIWNKDYEFFDSYREVGEALINGDVESFISRLSDLFAILTVTPQKYHENAVEMVISLVLRMAGCRVEEQVSAGNGIADIVVETHDTIYIIELKMDKNVDEAVAQIEAKKYAEKYLKEPRYKDFKVVGVGLCFNSVNCELTGSNYKELKK